MRNEVKPASAQEKAEGKTHQSGQRESQKELVELVKRYTDLLENAWEANPETKEREYKRIKLAIKCQLAMSCPSPLVLTLLERDDPTKDTEIGLDSVRMPDSLKQKISSVADNLGCSENNAIVAVLSENISKYLKDGEEQEGDDVVDF